MSKVTFKDVAKLAGVSTQTVSRVTNDALNVNAETRKKVKEAIEELGYVPNKGAQLLVRQNARTFGVLTLDISLQGASRILEGIRNESKKAGFGVSLAVIYEAKKEVEIAIKELKSQQVDAILVNLPVTKKVAEKIVQKYHPIPFVFIDVDPEASVNQVSADHYTGGKLAAELMIKQQRKQFVLINGPEFSAASQLRNKAWKEVIENANANIVIENNGDWSAQSGYVKAMEVFASAQSFDAILVANDQMCLGVLRACNEHNINVPKQVAIIGFDDTMNSEFFSPPLTTIRQDFLEVGHLAVEKVLDCINSNYLKPSKVVIPVTLIERKSTCVLEESSEHTEKMEKILNEMKKVLAQFKTT